MSLFQMHWPVSHNNTVFLQVVAGVGKALFSHRNHQLLLDIVIRAKHLAEANYIGSLWGKKDKWDDICSRGTYLPPSLPAKRPDTTT